MSLNQSRPEKSELSQYRKSGRSGSSGQQRNFSGGSGKGGGGTAPPPSSSSSISSSLPSNRSFKKSSNAQGGQSRASGANVNSDSNNAAAARTIQNGAHAQPSLHGACDAAAKGVAAKPNDLSSQKSIRAVPKAPTSHDPTVSSDTTAPATPSKAPGDAARSFPLQFGSISPGFINGMQIPARTSSAPPNLDEQKRDQACHDSLRAKPALPTPSIPKQQLTRKDVGGVEQTNSGEPHPMSKVKMDMQVSAAPPVTQMQKPTVHPISGIPMQIPFHQPHVQFGGPNPQIQTQGMTATSLPMPMKMPLPMGNPQVQPQVFVSGLQRHPIPPQGIMPQGQSLNFTSQIGGAQMPSQLGNYGISVPPQFPRQQAGKFGGSCKVKITHPETHEELRLDKRADTFMDSGSAGARSHPNVPPQSQPIPSYPPVHPINYYANSYNAGSPFFPVPSSLPLTGGQIAPSSQPTRFNYQVSQGPTSVSFMNPPALNSFSVNRTGAMHGVAEPSNLEHSRDVHNAIFSTSSASVQVTVKPAAGLHGEKVADSSLVICSPAVEKGESPKLLRSHREATFTYPPRDPNNSSESSLQQSRPSPETLSTSIPVTSKQSAAVSAPIPAESQVTNYLSSALAIPAEGSASIAASGTEGTKNQVLSRYDSIKDQQTSSDKKGMSLKQNQVSGKSASSSGLPSQALEQSNSFNRGISETAEGKTAPDSPRTSGVDLETTRLSSTMGVAASDVSGSKTGSALEAMCESSEMLGAGTIGNALDNAHYATQTDLSLQDEQPEPETVGTKERVEIWLAEGSEQDRSGFETALDSVSLKSSEVILHTEQNSFPKVMAAGNDAGPLETVKRELEEPAGCSPVDEMVADSLVTSSSTLLNAVNGETSPSSIGLSTFSHGKKTATSDASLRRYDSMGSEDVTKSGMLNEESAPNSIPSLSEATLKLESDIVDNISTGMALPAASGSKDKPVTEPNREKNTMATRKKKRKEILQKADAAGTTSDLYMAYKGPEEKKEIVTSSESSPRVSLKQVPDDASQGVVISSERGGQSKAEPDDWEDAADISTPKLETSDIGKLVHGGMNHHGEDGVGIVAKKYSRDFLLKFLEQCTDLPEGFEITSDIAEALMVSNVDVSHDSYPSPGRIIDRSSGVSRADHRGSGMGDDDKWTKVPGALASGREMRLDASYGGNVSRPGQGGNYGVLRNPRAQTPVQYAGGILSGPTQSMGSQGSMQRNNSDSDRWQRATVFQKGLIPSPQTPLQVMHKAEKKYKVGKATDEEEAKQRQLKAILNKLTPQNFEKLFEQVKQVNIDSANTLTGVISQIFDKALMEPTFCEMYANFCHHLAGELPDFIESGEKITFKRVLLNKCQEEFEKVKKEEEEANRADEEGEAKQSEEEREEKRIRARRRMLGNIRLIGELYKKRMLTERIMHECIKKLLGQHQNPDEEDVESLCKLMSTIGEMIDHPKAKEHMDAYFDMMANFSNNMKLSSRVRFMLKDSIDLRKNKWQQRRKVEGPKKIEEVHRDAAQERHAQVTRLSRGPSMNSSVRRGQPVDFAPRGSNMLSSPNAQMGGFRGLPTQLRGYGGQDVRMDDRHSFENRTLSVPLPQRPVGDDSITLGPQGGLARGMSIRGQPPIASIHLADMPSPGESRRVTAGLNGYSSVSERTAYREDLNPRYTQERFANPPAYDQSNAQERNVNYGNRDMTNVDHSFDRFLPASPSSRGRGPTQTQNVPSEKMWPEEYLRDKSITAIKEFYSAKDEKEVALCVEDLNAPSFYPSMISIWVTDSFERKDMERDLLANLLINLTKSRECMLSQDQLIKGFESVLTALEDAVNDAPKAAEFLGRIFAKVILENIVPFTEIGRLIYEGGEEQGRLVEMGLAAEVLGSILEIIKSEKGDSTLKEIRMASNLQLEHFRPPNSNKSWRLDKFI